jgi:NADPH:quinone reductase-like Zn-dependent oxidoreductase
MENLDLPTTFKGVIFKSVNNVEYGDINYNLNDIDDNYAVVKVTSAGLGPYDLGYIIGRLKTDLKDYALGCEGAGVVVKVGKACDASLVGKRVGFLSNYGDPKSVLAFAEYSVVPCKSLVLLPEDVDEQQATYLLSNPLSAVCLFNDKIKDKCKALIVDTAGSAIVKMINRLCKAHDITVINVVRREENVKLLNDLGFANVYNSTASDYNDKIKAAIDEIKPSIYLSFMGGDFPVKMFERLLPGSTMVCAGNINNEKLHGFGSPDFIFKDKSIEGFHLFVYLKTVPEEDRKALIDCILKNLSSKDSTYHTEVSKEFKFSEFEEARKYYESNMSKGKILLKP